MTREEIRQNAAEYVLNFEPTGVITEDRLKCYIAGAHSCDEEIKQLKKALSSAQKAMAELAEIARNPWISVEERLPDNDTLCAVILADNEIVIARYFNCGFIINRTKPVTHWMPIPPLSPDEQLISGLKHMQQDLEKGGTK